MRWSFPWPTPPHRDTEYSGEEPSIQKSRLDRTYSKDMIWRETQREISWHSWKQFVKVFSITQHQLYFANDDLFPWLPFRLRYSVLLHFLVTFLYSSWSYSTSTRFFPLLTSEFSLDLGLTVSMKTRSAFSCSICIGCQEGSKNSENFDKNLQEIKREREYLRNIFRPNDLSTDSEFLCKGRWGEQNPGDLHCRTYTT